MDKIDLFKKWWEENKRKRRTSMLNTKEIALEAWLAGWKAGDLQVEIHETLEG